MKVKITRIVEYRPENWLEAREMIRIGWVENNPEKRKGI